VLTFGRANNGQLGRATLEVCVGVVVWCSVLQCVAACCSVLQRHTHSHTHSHSHTHKFTHTYTHKHTQTHTHTHTHIHIHTHTHTGWYCASTSARCASKMPHRPTMRSGTPKYQFKRDLDFRTSMIRLHFLRVPTENILQDRIQKQNWLFVLYKDIIQWSNDSQWLKKSLPSTHSFFLPFFLYWVAKTRSTVITGPCPGRSFPINLPSAACVKFRVKRGVSVEEVPSEGKPITTSFSLFWSGGCNDPKRCSRESWVDKGPDKEEQNKQLICTTRFGNSGAEWHYVSPVSYWFLVSAKSMNLQIFLSKMTWVSGRQNQKMNTVRTYAVSLLALESEISECLWFDCIVWECQGNTTCLARQNQTFKKSTKIKQMRTCVLLLSLNVRFCFTFWHSIHRSIDSSEPDVNAVSCLILVWNWFENTVKL